MGTLCAYSTLEGPTVNFDNTLTLSMVQLESQAQRYTMPWLLSYSRPYFPRIPVYDVYGNNDPINFQTAAAYMGTA